MIKKNRLTAIEQVNIAQVKKVGKAQGSVGRDCADIFSFLHLYWKLDH